VGGKQGENDFLHRYDPKIFDRPNCTVDIAIFTVRDSGLHVLLVQRDAHPFKDSWALVGGFIDIAGDVDLESAARRKLLEKTGVSAPYLEQFGTVGNRKRDPRGWSITTVYFALISSEEVILTPGEGASQIGWSRIHGAAVAEDLAFDHAGLLAGCLRRLRDKVLYTSLPVHLMPGAFTLGELQKVYELILGAKLTHKAFRRRMANAGILEETGAYRHEAKRPAQLYRPKEDLNTHFFLRNLEGSTRGNPCGGVKAP
jgi:ADP-ribose pyrophosphatase YjhB (NUDIX family)